jgi:hypothetical protein
LRFQGFDIQGVNGFRYIKFKSSYFCGSQESRFQGFKKKLGFEFIGIIVDFRFQGFKITRFQGFEVLLFIEFRFSRFLGIKVSGF